MLAPSELPEGPLTRYQRDLYAFVEDKESMSFEQFQRQWQEEHDRSVTELNRTNPVVFDRTIRLRLVHHYEYVSMYKRQGLEWSCFYDSGDPHGEYGKKSLDEALQLVNDPKITQEVKNL